ncbi:hypothetical protein BST81_25715 [Leptolyngbya sp. 'hensonii']|uniref:hypothetical protein n=1 Tax=Leptolyngbya sp. 'hensonii' TaxID=1922337 RepID=UPI00094F6784|nr:hypothetical protein [Leptolyngbya sp. 'hensonii']OLP15549.1 hypothetical protein BST81_25715 [Leptolyngbya sp. 'hensonii']
MTDSSIPKDSDTLTLEELGAAVIKANVKFRLLPPDETLDLWEPIQELNDKYSDAVIKLLKKGVITTSGDVQNMKAIHQEIGRAANSQSLLSSVLKVITFLKSGPFFV